MKTELEKLWLTVEATARVRDQVLDAILERVNCASLSTPLELTTSERYVLELLGRQLQGARAAYQEAKSRASQQIVQ